MGMATMGMAPMRMAIAVFICAAMLVAGEQSAKAGIKDKWHQFWSGVKADFHRVNRWPKPFLYPDREAVHAPFQQMIANGWQRQTTLGHHHFHPETDHLNSAGVEMVRWIMTQAPVSRRALYVTRGSNSQVTSRRVDAVQQAAVEFLPQGTLPEVLETNQSPAGVPAELVYLKFVKYQQTLPPPRLPPAGGEEG